MSRGPAWIVARGRVYLGTVLRRSRWAEFRTLIEMARSHGFHPISLEDWMSAPRSQGRWIVLRHDVDQSQASARRMFELERELDVRSTYYFRWCTLDVKLAREMRSAGFGVGLHYETLTRYAIERDMRRPSQVDEAMLEACRMTLREEIVRFGKLTGAATSVAAHGDRRAGMIGATNDALLAGEEPEAYGVTHSADASALVESFDAWVSDGNPVERSWSGMPLADALSSDARIVLFNSHPNHWGTGLTVLVPRLLRNVGSLVVGPRGFTWGRPEATAWKQYAR